MSDCCSIAEACIVALGGVVTAYVGLFGIYYKLIKIKEEIHLKLHQIEQKIKTKIV